MRKTLTNDPGLEVKSVFELRSVAAQLFDRFPSVVDHQNRPNLVFGFRDLHWFQRRNSINLAEGGSGVTYKLLWY